MSAGPSKAEALGNRFHLLALVFQRTRQLKAGARPRIPAEDHKPTRLALLEVLADTVSWSLEDPVPENAAPGTTGLFGHSL